ncbi:MAG: bifunctional hydroxymethylpyrimidine kinase/phosphomethylpyrimidine kinase [Pseudomonadota bacterium]
MSAPERTWAVFSSHVARGTVGLRAAALALEALGDHVWSVPTILLPHHPGHGVPARVVADEGQFEDLVEGLLRPHWIAELDAVLCGYFASAQQVQTVAGFIDRVRHEQSITVIVDPVIGDHGRLYVPVDVAEAVRDVLLPRADIITPNRFELGWLAGGDHAVEPTINEDLLAMIDTLNQQRRADASPMTTLVTSAFALMEGSTGSLLAVGEKPALVAEHRHFDPVPNGMGDLTAALFAHHMVRGRSGQEALRLTTSSVLDVLMNTLKAGRDELVLEASLPSLTRSLAPVQVRQMLKKRVKNP